MTQGPGIAIIVPFLNEEDGIARLVVELNALVRANDAYRFEIVYVDDGSDDDSVARVLAAKHDYFFRLIKLSRNFGSHAALRAGIQHATSGLITFLYADLQDPPQGGCPTDC